MVQNFAWQTNSLILYIVSFFINARDFNRFLKSSGKWLIVISYAVYSGATMPEEGPPRIRLADPSPACPGVRSVVKLASKLYGRSVSPTKRIRGALIH